jgi:ATP-citrate lyase beta-subunit
MAQKAIREYDAKSILARHWDTYFPKFNYPYQTILVETGEQLKKAAETTHPWLKEKPLVAKPDMLFGKRGKNGLVLFKVNKPGDVTLEDAANWIDKKRATKQKVYFSFDGDTPAGEPSEDYLTHFIVEPFTPHSQDEEYYISATVVGDDDVLYMSAEGGMEVEENWDKVIEVKFKINETEDDIEKKIRENIPADVKEEDKENFAEFAIGFFKAYRELNFAYLEINPFVMQDNKIELLDMVAKLDDTAGFMMVDHWGKIEFPMPFGMEAKSKEEQAVEEADSKTGASLKLTVLKPEARIWTMVAGVVLVLYMLIPLQTLLELPTLQTMESIVEVQQQVRQSSMLRQF